MQIARRVVRSFGLRFRGSLGEEDEPHYFYQSLLQAYHRREALSTQQRAQLRTELGRAPAVIRRVGELALLEDLFLKLSLLQLCSPECQEALFERAMSLHQSSTNRLQALLFLARYFQGLFQKQSLIEKQLLQLIRLSEVPLNLSTYRQVLSSLFLVRQVCEFQAPRVQASLGALFLQHQRQFTTLSDHQLAELLTYLQICRSKCAGPLLQLFIERQKNVLDHASTLSDISHSHQPSHTTTYQELSALYCYSSAPERRQLKELILRRGQTESISMSACLRLLGSLTHIGQLDLLSRVFQQFQSATIIGHSFVTSNFLARLADLDPKVTEVFGRSVIVEFGQKFLRMVGSRRGLWKKEQDLQMFRELVQRQSAK